MHGWGVGGGGRGLGEHMEFCMQRNDTALILNSSRPNIAALITTRL